MGTEINGAVNTNVIVSSVGKNKELDLIESDAQNEKVSIK
jgi:hypothetical protein|tara:strand:- start:3959 stop:4078 length:120 start_codon:yes stop_codon:yes gene_type:complete